MITFGHYIENIFKNILTPLQKRVKIYNCNYIMLNKKISKKLIKEDIQNNKVITMENKSSLITKLEKAATATIKPKRKKKKVKKKKVEEKTIEPEEINGAEKVTIKQNNIYTGNNLDILKHFNDESIDLVVTYPPYDKLRSYKGNYKIDLTELGKEIHRVLKDGGIYAMVMQDQTKNFGKSLTTFRTAISHVDIIGFKLFETCIYQKLGCEGAWWTKRFRVDHEYILIFLKGKRPRYFDKEPIKIPSKHGGKTMTGCATRKTDGTTFKSKKVTINKMKCPGTIWNYANGGDKNKLKRKHPAVFPDKIPRDLIQVFCPEGGVVLDPMCGSGSTLVQAKQLKRNFIGIDIEQEYVDLANQRLEEEC